MKQYAVIGIGAFGSRVVQELQKMNAEIIILDRDREIIEKFKDIVTEAYIVDAGDEEVILKLIPKTIDGVILDLPSNLETSILVTSYLKKMGVSNIIVKSDSDKHGEILTTVGATSIIYPDYEAARRVTPLLLSDTLFNFMPISSGLVMAEIYVPNKYVGKTLIESNLRYKEGINIVAIKKGNDSEYSFFVPDYKLGKDDILLAVGEDDNVRKFTSVQISNRSSNIATLFQRMFGNN